MRSVLVGGCISIVTGEALPWCLVRGCLAIRISTKQWVFMSSYGCCFIRVSNPHNTLIGPRDAPPTPTTHSASHNARNTHITGKTPPPRLPDPTMNNPEQQDTCVAAQHTPTAVFNKFCSFGYENTTSNSRNLQRDGFGMECAGAAEALLGCIYLGGFEAEGVLNGSGGFSYTAG